MCVYLCIKDCLPCIENIIYGSCSFNIFDEFILVRLKILKADPIDRLSIFFFTST